MYISHQGSYKTVTEDLVGQTDWVWGLWDVVWETSELEMGLEAKPGYLLEVKLELGLEAKLELALEPG